MVIIKAVIFDIGGVVVRSPMLGVAKYEKKYDLPPNYINCIIANQGAEGAFQKFERGEISLFPFYEAFGRELSTPQGRAWYREYCVRRQKGCPPIPDNIKIDGRELFGCMMREASEYDELMVNAIQRIRASRKYRVIALTNNFSKSEESMLADAPHTPDFSLQREKEFLGWHDGATPTKLKELFDDFCDSSTMGLRKPDPKFYLLACKRNGVHPEEVVFLDDIGYNLKAAKNLGMQTIQVVIDKSKEALQELGELLGMDLLGQETAKL